VAGYAALMMASLLGPTSSRAQILATPTVASTPTATPTTVASNLTVNPRQLVFGFQDVLPPDGAPSKPKNIVLSVARNQPQAVTIEQPLMTSDPAEFIVQSNSCSVIAPGTSCPVPIVFQPNGARKRTAMLLITSNANNGVQSVNLIGHGKQGVISFHPDALSFPVADVGAPPGASKSVTIINKNAVKLTIEAITSSNPDAFPITSSCPGTLQPSAQCTVSASFAADRNGGIRGYINVVNNSAGPDRIRLSGSGRGGPTTTRTATPSRTPTPTAMPTPDPFTLRAFPVIH